MKLHAFPFAPNAAKVRLYLAEKEEGGAALPIEEVTVNLLEGEQKSEAYLALNPRGTVPTLEIEGGPILIESLAIIEYIEERFPDPPMWGTDPESRADARQIERAVDQGGLGAIANEVHATNSPIGLPPNPVLAENARERRARMITFMEGVMADGREFLAGDRPTVADCTLQAALQFGRLREIDGLEGAPRLQAWCDRYRERPAAKRTILV